jgi:hypothetical protein
MSRLEDAPPRCLARCRCKDRKQQMFISVPLDFLYEFNVSFRPSWAEAELVKTACSKRLFPQPIFFSEFDF